MKIGDLIERLKQYDDQTPCAYSLWLPHDIRDAGELRGENPLTESDIEEILDSVQRQQDASIGINHDVIEAHIEMHRADKGE
jgi:hypothetical protein